MTKHAYSGCTISHIRYSPYTCYQDVKPHIWDTRHTYVIRQFHLTYKTLTIHASSGDYHLTYETLSIHSSSYCNTSHMRYSPYMLHQSVPPHIKDTHHTCVIWLYLLTYDTLPIHASSGCNTSHMRQIPFMCHQTVRLTYETLTIHTWGFTTSHMRHQLYMHHQAAPPHIWDNQNSCVMRLFDLTYEALTTHI